MADRPLDDQERRAIAAWLEERRPTICPRTGTGEELPWLRTLASLAAAAARERGAVAKRDAVREQQRIAAA